MNDWKLYHLIKVFIQSKWDGIRYVVSKKRRKFVTTNDLTQMGKLKSNYLEEREYRKKEREINPLHSNVPWWHGW